MTLKELVGSVDIERTLEILQGFHKDSWLHFAREAYEDVINKLRQISYKDGGLKFIKVQNDYDVFGIAEDSSLLGKGQSSGVTTSPIGLDFVDWSELIEVPIESKLEDNARTLAAILYEITFYGFSCEAIRKKRNEIEGFIKNLEQDI